MRALVWKNYSQAQFGAPRILAIALSDEADDNGGGIFQSAAKLAEKTEQGERAVRAQLKRMELSGLLVVVQKSAGGPGQFNHYRLDIGVLIGVSNPASGAGLTMHLEQGLTGPNPVPGAWLAGPLYKELKEVNVEDDVRSTVTDAAEDRRLGEWIFARLLVLNPRHRAPSWAAWCNDIRLMRERDQRTRREIAALFAYANSDPFWQLNVLSPGTLRKQWDRLELKRRANGGGGQAQAPAIDNRCARELAGNRCTKSAAFWDREGRGLCRQCREETERERASVKA